MHNTPICSVDDVIAAFNAIRQDPSITTFNILLAPDAYIAVRDRREPLRINALQRQAITDIRTTSDCSALTTHVSHSVAAAPDPSCQDIIPITLG